MTKKLPRALVAAACYLFFLQAIAYTQSKPDTSTSPRPAPGPTPHPRPMRGDSPAEVVGGSLFLKWESGYVPGSCTAPPGVTCVPSDGRFAMNLRNLGTLPAKVDLKKGWRIVIDDPNGEVLRVCSDPGCADPPTTWDGREFYVKTRPDEKEISLAGHPNEKHYHDDGKCPGGHETRKCDRAIRFKFDFDGISYKPPGTLPCDDNIAEDPAKQCVVFIGIQKH